MSFEKGASIDHMLPPDHLALTTGDGTLVGLSTNGHMSIRAKEVDISKARRIDTLVFRIIRAIENAVGRKNTYEIESMFHLTVKEENLKRFLRASIASALSSYLKVKLGERARVQALLVELADDFAVGMGGPDDLDFLVFSEISRRSKGFLLRHLSRAVKTHRQLVGG